MSTYTFIYTHTSVYPTFASTDPSTSRLDQTEVHWLLIWASTKIQSPTCHLQSKSSGTLRLYVV